MGEISDTFWSRIIKSAEKRNHTFSITKEYVWGLFLKQNGKCALSGLEIKIKRPLVLANKWRRSLRAVSMQHYLCFYWLLASVFVIQSHPKSE